MKGKNYLPPESQANTAYIHDVMNGKKKVSYTIEIIKSKDTDTKGCNYDSYISYRWVESPPNPRRSKKALTD